MNHKVRDSVQSRLVQVKKNIHHMLIDNPNGITVEFIQNRLSEQNIHKDDKAIKNALYNLTRENRAVSKRITNVLVWYPGTTRPVPFGRAQNHVPRSVRAALLKMETNTPDSRGYLAKEIHGFIEEESGNNITIIQIQSALSNGATRNKKRWTTRQPDPITGDFRYKLLPLYKLIHGVSDKTLHSLTGLQQGNLFPTTTQEKRVTPEARQTPAEEAPWCNMPHTKAIMAIMQTYGDGEKGHSIQDLMAALDNQYTELQTQRTLWTLLRNGFVKSQRHGVEIRYSIGSQVFEFSHQRNKQRLTLEAFKYFDKSFPSSRGYTTAEIGEYMHATWKCAKGCANSACLQLFHKGLLERQKDRTAHGTPFRYKTKQIPMENLTVPPTAHPPSVAPAPPNRRITIPRRRVVSPRVAIAPVECSTNIPPSSAAVVAQTPTPPSLQPPATSLHDKVSKVYDETRTIIHDALTSMEISKDKREYAFAILDAFNTFLKI
jgi:hypothetical protein